CYLFSLFNSSLVSPCALSFFFYSSVAHRHLHSFPTRRSSDLAHARTWSSDEIGTIISDLLHRLRASVPAGQGFTDIDRELIELQLRSMESYGVPLSAYRDVYTALSKISHDAGELESFSRTNQNLMLNPGLVALENVKDQLPRPSQETPAQTPAQMAPQAPQKPFRASPQQKAAITTDEPCALVQAAA